MADTFFNHDFMRLSWLSGKIICSCMCRLSTYCIFRRNSEAWSL